MYRYTTPTIPVTIAGIDFADVSLFRVKIEQDDVEMLKIIEANDSSVDAENHTIYVQLTQEETAALIKGGCEIQARILFSSGAVQATNKAKLSVYDVLDEVIL